MFILYTYIYSGKNYKTFKEAESLIIQHILKDELICLSLRMRSLVDPADWRHRSSTPSEDDGLGAGDGMVNLTASL